MFEHIAKRLAASEAAWLDLPEVAPRARLLLRAATEQNSAYYNAMLRKAAARMRAPRRANAVTVEQLAQDRADDRELFAAHVLVNWEGVEDVSGNPVPFSVQLAREFLDALPAFVFDRIRTFALTPERFLSQDDPVPDGAELAKNSQSGSAGS